MRKHNTRRGAALAAAVTLVAGMTAACGSGGDTATQAKMSKDDVLTITTFSDFGYDKLIKQWNADPNRPFTVHQTKIADWDTWKKTLTQDLQSGHGLTDIVAIEGDSMPQFLSPGASEQFADLTDHSLDHRWIDYKYKAGQTTSGEQIGYPTDAGPEAFCYRQDLFKKAGLPSTPDAVKPIFKTWDTYFAAGAKLHKALPKTAWYDSSGSIAQAMLNQTHYPFQTADEKVNVNNDELKGVWNAVTSHEALSTKVVQWGDDWMALFKNDGFATIPCPGWMFANIKSSAPDVKGWNIVDAFPGGGGNWGGSFLSVPATSKHQAEAKQFAAYLTDTKSELAAFEAAGNYPSNAAAEKALAAKDATDPYFNGAHTAKILADRAAAVKPNLPYKGDKYSDILGLFQTAIQRVDEGTSPTDSWNTFLQAVQGLS